MFVEANTSETILNERCIQILGLPSQKRFGHLPQMFTEGQRNITKKHGRPKGNICRDGADKKTKALRERIGEANVQRTESNARIHAAEEKK